MHLVLRCGVACWLAVSVAVVPVAAQVDQIGGPVEFRSPDRPISAPTLRVPESAGLPSDSGKLSSAGMPAPEEVLKRIDTALGRTLSRSEPGPPGAPDKTDDQLEQRTQTKGTFK
jgi:hypothetical protein